MRSVILHFLNQDVTNFHPLVYWGLGIVWGILLVAAFASVRSLMIPVSGKTLWFMLILLIPILGLALYAMRCLVRSDWAFLKPLFQSRAQAVRAVANTAERRFDN